MNEDRPWISADSVVFDTHDRLLLIRRKNEPFQGSFALPGGFMELGETTQETAMRELKEETGIEAQDPQLIGVYSKPGRDPRHHTVTIAYLCFVEPVEPMAGDDAAAAEFRSDWADLTLAFDHNLILKDALALRARLHATLGKHG
ncbi:MAG TPA: NUDIX hydrolase [Micropepsaceae bacterium]|nr:NUDIX hydrolase [Micropepsaceae bacterium]